MLKNIAPVHATTNIGRQARHLYAALQIETRRTSPFYFKSLMLPWALEYFRWGKDRWGKTQIWSIQLQRDFYFLSISFFSR